MATDKPVAFSVAFSETMSYADKSRAMGSVYDKITALDTLLWSLANSHSELSYKVGKLIDKVAQLANRMDTLNETERVRHVLEKLNNNQLIITKADERSNR